MIYFVDIDENNWRQGLSVSQAQEGFVAGEIKILARAYAYRNSRSKAYYVCQDDEAVGMVMFHDWDQMGAYVLSELFIDERYQGKGFGIKAAQLALDEMKADGKYASVILCYVDGNTAACDMFTKLGFVPTGEVDEDEIIMKLDFQH